MRLVGVFVLLAPIVCATTLVAQSISEPSGVTISVTSAGAFTIQSGEPPWIYSGSVPGPVTDIAGPASGFDHNLVSVNGPFDELTVDYSDADGSPWRMQLRAYRSIPSPIISFSPQTAVPNHPPYAVLNQFPVT